MGTGRTSLRSYTFIFGFKLPFSITSLYPSGFFRVGDTRVGGHLFRQLIPELPWDEYMIPQPVAQEKLGPVRMQLDGNAARNFSDRVDYLQYHVQIITAGLQQRIPIRM